MFAENCCFRMKLGLATGWVLLRVFLPDGNIRPSIPEIHFVRAAYQQWDSLLYCR